MPEIIWVCNRCNRALDGNPRLCPHCGYTVYRPTRPGTVLPKTRHAGRPMLDFPTAWRIARRGLIHTTWRCSYVQTQGALLCDCGAIEREWRRLGRARDDLR